MLSLRSLGFYCYFQALCIGLKSILAGDARNGLKLLGASVGYWRFLPNALVLRLVRQNKPERILDVSSPKLLSLILSADHDVLALDLDDPQLEIRWAKTARILGHTRFSHRYENACQLHIADASYPFVYSLSVIEHIPGDGDTRAMREIARVLTPGGKALIEVPLRYEHTDVFRKYDSKGFALPQAQFYERLYSPESISRLRIPELRLIGEWAMGEFLPFDPWIAGPRLPRLLRLAALPFEPFLGAWNMWLEAKPGRARPLSMILLFEKPKTEQ
ncbi:MAG: class I SAM-dependent methyltransferase [Bryobacteraceae bacterium]